MLRIYSLAKSDPILLEEVRFDFKGPIDQFTVWSDLERGKITVAGRSAKGWFRYHLASLKDLAGVRLWADRLPSGGFSFQQKNGAISLQQNESIDLFSPEIPVPISLFQDLYQPPKGAFLTLGNHKTQDVELIRRRLDLTEIFPLWHKMGELIPGDGWSCPLSDGRDSLSFAEV